MSFAPVIPFRGLAGLAFLQRTRDAQQQTLVATPRIARSTDAFAQRIAKIPDAAALVKDRQLLEVALGAFGLDADINNRFLIEKILSSDTTDPSSLAMRFTDKRYLALSKAFGFGAAGGPRVVDPGFADRIVGAYRDRQFEIAVGDAAPDMRLALGFQRDLGEIAGRRGLSNDGAWFSVMATPPLRRVFETALGLPASFGTLDLDRQLADLKDRAQRIFGTSDIGRLAAPAKTEEITRGFLIRAQIAEGAATINSGAATALMLLRAGR